MLFGDNVIQEAMHTSLAHMTDYFVGCLLYGKTGITGNQDNKSLCFRVVVVVFFFSFSYFFSYSSFSLEAQRHVSFLTIITKIQPAT